MKTVEKIGLILLLNAWGFQQGQPLSQDSTSVQQRVLGQAGLIDDDEADSAFTVPLVIEPSSSAVRPHLKVLSFSTQLAKQEASKDDSEAGEKGDETGQEREKRKVYKYKLKAEPSKVDDEAKKYSYFKRKYHRLIPARLPLRKTTPKAAKFVPSPTEKSQERRHVLSQRVQPIPQQSLDDDRPEDDEAQGKEEVKQELLQQHGHQEPQVEEHQVPDQRQQVEQEDEVHQQETRRNVSPAAEVRRPPRQSSKASLKRERKYHFQYSTDNGSSRKEEGYLKNHPGVKNPVLVQEGSFSYKGPDGQIYTVEYVADEKGYRARGSHINERPPFFSGE